MTTAKNKQFGRAFNAAVSTDWLITEDAFRTLLSVAARIEPGHQPKAVDAEGAYEGWEDDSAMYVRDGIAVIPVTGPIFRYANLFTYFCGGASVGSLAKDLNHALNDNAVSAVMFEINSPGGEVTGINEFCEMIYAARSKKPITARVGGYGCSAAYWIASACGDIVVDETAQLGSIGVMAVYLDDRKAYEMAGFEEIEFISSQSPYKNSPPWTDEGRKRIQTRIDALAQVFVDKVARNRDVSVETVLKEFGQGDVFVGQKAIDAGLADRLGSFHSSLYELAETHNPNFTGGEQAGPDEEIDMSFSDKVKSLFGSFGLKVEEEDAATINNSETLSSTEDVASTADETPEAAEPNTEKPAEESMNNNKENAQTENASADLAKTAADLQAREDALAEREKAITDREAAAKQTEDEAAKARAAAQATEQKVRFEKAAESFAGDKAAKVSFMTDLAEKFGEESSQFTSYVEDQTALGAQLEASSLFDETGKPGADTSSDASARMDTLAKARATADSISFEKAYNLVASENPALASAAIEGAPIPAE